MLEKFVRQWRREFSELAARRPQAIPRAAWIEQNADLLPTPPDLGKVQINKKGFWVVINPETHVGEKVVKLVRYGKARQELTAKEFDEMMKNKRSK